MEKRSRRRIRDLVTLLASQGLSENEIECTRISMMAKSTNALITGRIQKRKTNPLRHSHRICNTRPVYTEGVTTVVIDEFHPSRATSRRRGFPSMPAAYRAVEPHPRDKIKLGNPHRRHARGRSHRGIGSPALPRREPLLPTAVACSQLLLRKIPCDNRRVWRFLVPTSCK
jgi:hypothetical protein